MPTAYFRRGAGAARRRSAATKIAAAARGRIVRKARGPVKRIQSKPFVPRVVKNTQSVVSLSRAVKQLQNQQLGLVQKQVQHANCSMSVLGLTNQRPWCFAVNQFAQPVPTGGNVNDYPEIFATAANNTVGFAGRWAVWQNSAGEMGIPDRFNNWMGALDDEVSKEVYQPLSASYQFSFRCKMKPEDPPTWIRLDYLRPKKILRTSTDHEFNLPQAMPGFAYLAQDEMAHRNRINREYWTVKTKWVKIANSTTHGQLGVDKDVTVRCKMGYKFNQTLEPDLNEAGSTGHQWYLNVPVKKQQWLLISTNKTSFHSTDFMCVERRIVWRDQHGAAT